MCMCKCSRFWKIISVVVTAIVFSLLVFGNNYGVDDQGYGVRSAPGELDEVLSKEGRNSKAQKAPRNHIAAVGIAYIRLDGRNADRGTATLVEPHIAVSAAHVFKRVLPRRPIAQKSGPIRIDLRNMPVYWSYQPDDGRPAQKVRVLSLVVDARFLHALETCRKNRLSREAQKHDLVFLELDPQDMPRNVTCVPMLTGNCSVGQMCASYGYGVVSLRDYPVRKGIVYNLTLPQRSYDHDVILLANRNNMPDGDYQRAVREVGMLTGRPGLAPHEAYVGQALQGDSGGPLFAVTPKGIRVIGVMSIYGAERYAEDILYYNGFCSLITGDQTNGYALSGRAKELLSHLKKNRLG